MKRTLLLLSLALAVSLTLGVVRSRGARNETAIRPEIVSFTATPRTVALGESVTLAWMTRGIPSVAIGWAPENHPRGAMQRHAGLPPVGTMIVLPRENTIYVLECEASVGETCMAASTTVRVRQPAETR